MCSEDHGGMGMGPVEGMVVMEELGRGIVLEPLAQCPDCGCRAEPAMPTPPPKPTWLPQIAERRSHCWCWHIKSASSLQASAVAMRKPRKQDGHVEHHRHQSVVAVGDQADAF